MRDYENSAGQDPRSAVEEPANALDTMASELGDLESRMMLAASKATLTADRIFGDAVAISSGAKSEAKPESVNIPAIMSRIERLRLLANNLDHAINRLSAL